jgi:hypothetical protein
VRRCPLQETRWGWDGLRFVTRSADAQTVTEVSLEPQWVCVGCHSRMAMAEDTCLSCGRPFGAGLSLGDTDVVVRRTRAWLYVVRELVLLNLLFVLWRVAGHESVHRAASAYARGRSIWDAERALHLPNEAALQATVLGHATLSRIANGYYEYAHAPLLAVMVGWLLWRHRDAYPRWRNLILGFTGLSLLIDLVPVAPPRLVPSLHLVDLAARYHQSVYSTVGTGVSDQLSSMPSVHVGWALIVAAAVIVVGRSRWRWLAGLHPVITTYVVVITANHYWLDAVAALALLVAIREVTRRTRPGLVP